MNWKIIKIIAAVFVIIGIIVWATITIRPRSYDAANLNFVVGRGSVTVTNPSQESIPAQLVAAGSRTFRVSSANEAISGTSTRQGSGASTEQVFAFELSPGVNEFTVNHSTDVNFVANSATQLQATVNPVTNDTVLTSIVVAVFVILLSLFYISHTNGHRWMSAARRQEALDQTAAQDAESANFKRIFDRRSSANKP